MSEMINVVFQHDFGVISWTTTTPEELEALKRSGDLTVTIIAEGVSEDVAIGICRQQSGLNVGIWVLEQIKQDVANQDLHFFNALFSLKYNFEGQHAMIQTVGAFNSTIDGRAVALATISNMSVDPENRDHHMEMGLMACKYNWKALVVFLETMATMPHI